MQQVFSGIAEVIYIYEFITDDIGDIQLVGDVQNARDVLVQKQSSKGVL